MGGGGGQQTRGAGEWGDRGGPTHGTGDVLLLTHQK